MKVNEYLVVEDAVENGIAYGLMRAYKHTSEPSEEAIKREILNAVMNSLSEYFFFENTFAEEEDDQIRDLKIAIKKVYSLLE